MQNILYSDKASPVKDEQSISASDRGDPIKSSSREDHKKKLVQHNYHDYASQSDNQVSENCNLKHKNSHKGRVKVPFPFKLFDMLTHLELTGQNSDVVSWLPHGRSFLVHNTKEFESSVLPFFFQQKKYKSFQRQLNIYSFKRITDGRDKGSYYHERFLRDKRFLLMEVQRTKVKGIGARCACNPTAEPDLYTMPILPPSSLCLDPKPNTALNTELILTSSDNFVSSWKTQLDSDSLFCDDIDFDEIISLSRDEDIENEGDAIVCGIGCSPVYFKSNLSLVEEDEKAFLTDIEKISGMQEKVVTDDEFMRFVDDIICLKK